MRKYLTVYHSISDRFLQQRRVSGLLCSRRQGETHVDQLAEGYIELLEVEQHAQRL